MTAASILTIEPIGRGGVPVLAEVSYQALSGAGLNPHLVYVDAESVPTSGPLALLGYFARRWRPRWETRRGMRGLAIPRYPLPLWASWQAPGWVARGALNTPIRLLAAGSAHFGLPFAASDHPYVVWIAGMYGDELQARVDAGDAWAAGVLTSAQWPRLQLQETRVLQNAALILGISPYTVQQVVATHPELAERTATVLIPVDPAQFRPATADETAGAPPYLLLTARIVDPRKNTALLFRAYARVLAERPEVALRITGDPPDDRIRREATDAGVLDRVEFLGPQSPERLAELVRGAAVFVLTSNQEGLSVSVLEAMASGVPVVATRCGGPEGVVQDGETGFLTPLDDDEALAARVLHLLKHPDQRATMGRAARDYAIHTFTPEIVHRQLIGHLTTIYPQYIPNKTQ